MFVIGILGGVASGKSLVTQQLQQLGAATLDADKIGHEVLKEADVKQALRARWGDNIFGDDGEVQRSALAKIVFAPPPDGPRSLRELEQITHPRISARLQTQLAAWRKTSSLPAVVLDAPVLLKAGWNQLCDQILFVEATEEQRRARAATRGWSAADFAAREAAQESLAEKRRHATQVIDNTGTPEQTGEQVVRYWQKFIQPR